MLGAEPTKITLTPQEEFEIKNSFDAKIETTPYRYLPLTTFFMARLIMDHRNYEKLAKNVIERLAVDKFKNTIDLHTLKGLILRSMLAT